MNGSRYVKRLLLIAAAVFLCWLAGIPAEGAVFASAAFFISFPRLPQCRWYDIVIGALASDCIAMFFGESSIVFWGLLLISAAAVSLTNLPKTALLCVLGWLLLKIGTPPSIYVSLFIGIIWNAILAFTYEKICDTIKI